LCLWNLGLYSDMKIPIRIKILLFYYKLFHKKFYSSPLVKIGESGKGVTSILFFLPSERTHAQVISHLIKKNNDYDSLRFKYVLHQDSLTYYQDIPKHEILTFSDNDLNWFGAIKSKFIIKKIDQENYDALVDLNQSFDQTLSLLSIQLIIPIKIGFQSPISDQLYTVVVELEKNSFLESSYHTIENILGIS